MAEDDKKAFCTLSGLGVVIIGISLLLTAIIFVVTASALSFLLFAAGFVCRLMILVYAGKKTIPIPVRSIDRIPH